MVDFYVSHDTDPARGYPTVDGLVVKFDVLPEIYRGNVNTSEAPYDRQPATRPPSVRAKSTTWSPSCAR